MPDKVMHKNHLQQFAQRSSMGYSKDQLLARLQDLNIDFARYDHPSVVTVEAQAIHVGNFPGALSKNLFLKDKKQRFYIVSALANTTVDLKVLSQRLGLGKGGLRMAPEEALLEILQVPVGCVTPFAIVNESARNVALLLDQGLQNLECCFFHPLSNDASISLNTRDLEIFLKSIGKDPSYVDLEANPSVGKDQPPDLAALVPSGSIALSDVPEKATSSQAPPEKSVPLNNSTVTVTAKAAKPSNSSQTSTDKKAAAVKQQTPFNDTELFVEEILEKTAAIVLNEIKEDTFKQHGEQLGAVVSEKMKKQLSVELKNLAMMYKNTAYTEGFHAGTHRQTRFL